MRKYLRVKARDVISQLQKFGIKTDLVINTSIRMENARSVLNDVAPSIEIAGFGTNFKEDQTSVRSFGELNPDAVKLMDRSGWK